MIYRIGFDFLGRDLCGPWKVKKGFQKNDMHFNKQGNKMLAESIIKKLNQEKFTINNNLI